MTESTLLTQLGLSEKEVKIYELALSLGKIPAQTLVKESEMKRATVYSILDELIKKGLIEKDETDPVTKFRAKHPYALKEYLDSEVDKIKTAESKLDAVLPQFIAQYHKAQSRPGVKFYEGKAGIIKIHQEILAEKKEILAVVNIESAVDKTLDDYWPRYFKQRISGNIRVRAIVPDTDDGRKYQERDEKELRQTRLVSHDAFPISIEKNICGNKVALLSLQPDELIGVLIESSEIAKTERSVFELAWKGAS